MSLTSNVGDVALIFEGGGMRASYSSGVLTALLQGEVFCDWVGGISAGASCTANYLVRDLTRTKRSFVDLVQDPQFGDWRTFLKGDGVFNAEYIYERTAGPTEALPYDFDAYLSNPAMRRIGGFRCTDGEMLYWGKDEMSTPFDLMKRVRASSTMPLLMPLTEIDGVDYCDGALGPTGGIALDAARADGFERFLVVLTRERGYRKSPFKLGKAFRVLFRRYPAIAEALEKRHDNYNNTLDELYELEAQGKAHLVFPDQMPIGNSERDIAKLTAMFELGLAQGRADLPRIREFAGLPA